MEFGRIHMLNFGLGRPIILKPIHIPKFSAQNPSISFNFLTQLSNPSTGFSYWPIGKGLCNPVGGHLRILMGERPFSWRFYRKFKCFAAFFAKNWAQYIVLKYFCLTYKLILFLRWEHPVGEQPRRWRGIAYFCPWRGRPHLVPHTGEPWSMHQKYTLKTLQSTEISRFWGKITHPCVYIFDSNPCDYPPEWNTIKIN